MVDDLAGYVLADPIERAEVQRNALQWLDS